MTPSTKRSIIVIGASTAVGFLGDIITYSVAESKGKKFALHMPRGKQLAQVLFFGIVGGILLDMVVNKIVDSQKTQQELALEKLVKEDIAKIEAGELNATTPVKIQWV